jgi:small subunit ribosomal protein S6e
MVFKINISEKGKTFKLESDLEDFVGKKIGDSFLGKDLGADFQGYEFEITGTSDKAGFAGKKDVQGPALRKVLLTKGPFLKHVPHKGFRRKKTVRGNEVSLSTVQINLKVAKQGNKKLEEIFKKEESENKE